MGCFEIFYRFALFGPSELSKLRLPLTVANGYYDQMQLNLFDLIKGPPADGAAEKPVPGKSAPGRRTPAPGQGSLPQAASANRPARISPVRRIPLLKRVWLDVRRTWFPDRPDLDRYTVVWSRRPQKRTLASCNIESKRVNVARELNYPEHYRWLTPLLYHEMCHAYLGFSVVSEEDRCRWHGREFRALERRFPDMPEFDRWVKHGGWDRAVRSDRSKRAHRARKERLARLVPWNSSRME